jgi:hypothetical protein
LRSYLFLGLSLTSSWSSSSAHCTRSRSRADASPFRIRGRESLLPVRHFASGRRGEEGDDPDGDDDGGDSASSEMRAKSPSEDCL